MRFPLLYRPTPDNAPRFADDVTAVALRISGIVLDYSAASLEDVDWVLDGMRRDGVSTDDVAETLFGFGCYVGEVVRRNSGGQWWNASGTSMADIAGFPLVLKLGEGSFCNPIGKVFKRVDGDDDSLVEFYQMFSGQY